MLILGLGIVGIALSNFGSALGTTYAVAGDSLFVLLPGCLYIVASMRIELGVMAAGMLSMRISLLQSAACVLAVIASIAFDHAAGLSKLIPFLAPSYVICFLIPALLAQAVQLKGAINAMRLLPPVQPGFQIHTAPVPVITPLPVIAIEQPIPVVTLTAGPLPVVLLGESESESADAS